MFCSLAVGGGCYGLFYGCSRVQRTQLKPPELSPIIIHVMACGGGRLFCLRLFFGDRGSRRKMRPNSVS